MKVLYLGSSTFSKIVLEKMLDENVEVSAIITQPDKRAGRGKKLLPTEVNVFGKEKGVEVFTFDKIRNHMEEIKKIDYDLAVVASFGQILPQDFLDFKLTINVHPSLLPKYRGPSPIQTAIMNGDLQTGVTIMKVAKEVDSGDIILQKTVDINGQYYKELEQRLASLGGEMIVEVIKQIENRTIKFTPQNHDDATFTHKFNKEDGKLDFSLQANNIVNKTRALSEEVGCFIVLNDRIIKIGKVQDVSGQFSCQPNTILNYKKAFIIGCADGAVEILTCQAPSGKMVQGRDFINGHNNILGEKVL